MSRRYSVPEAVALHAVFPKDKDKKFFTYVKVAKDGIGELLDNEDSLAVVYRGVFYNDLDQCKVACSSADCILTLSLSSQLSRMLSGNAVRINTEEVEIDDIVGEYRVEFLYFRHDHDDKDSNWKYVEQNFSCALTRKLSKDELFAVLDAEGIIKSP